MRTPTSFRDRFSRRAIWRIASAAPSGRRKVTTCDMMTSMQCLQSNTKYTSEVVGCPLRGAYSLGLMRLHEQEWEGLLPRSGNGLKKPATISNCSLEEEPND